MQSYIQRKGEASDTLPTSSRRTHQAPAHEVLQQYTDKMSPQKAEQPNRTGLPDDLKQGIEHLSGFSMDQVRVHYNSSQPAQLYASAYAQGSDIHLAPGQERHLAHEAWHVVQQKQGRVRPTVQTKGLGVNTDQELEREADRMGGLALRQKTPLRRSAPTASPDNEPVAQLAKFTVLPLGILNQLLQIDTNQVVQSKKTLKPYIQNTLNPYVAMIAQQAQGPIDQKKTTAIEADISKLEIFLNNKGGSRDEACAQFNLILRSIDELVSILNQAPSRGNILEAVLKVIDVKLAIKLCFLFNDGKTPTPEMELMVGALCSTYQGSAMEFASPEELNAQVAQDVDLFLHNEPFLMGIPHQHNEYSRDCYSERNIDAKAPQIVPAHKAPPVPFDSVTRIYRCMPLVCWDQAKLKGHGGSLGEAMHYFRLKSKGDSMPQALVEFVVPGPLSSLITVEIGSEGEGSRSSGGRFGRKTEGTVAFGQQGDIFSVRFDKEGVKIIQNPEVVSRIIAYSGDTAPNEIVKPGLAWSVGPADLPAPSSQSDKKTNGVCATGSQYANYVYVFASFRFVPRIEGGNYFWGSLQELGFPWEQLTSVAKAKNIPLNAPVPPGSLSLIFDQLDVQCDLIVFDYLGRAEEQTAPKPIVRGSGSKKIYLAAFVCGGNVVNFAPPLR